MNNTEASYKVWHCNYYWNGNWGAYQEYECVVVAEIQSKALGMALMDYPDTIAECWTATEIPINKEGVHLRVARKPTPFRGWVVDDNK